jgi:hypothetical protein
MKTYLMYAVIFGVGYFVGTKYPMLLKSVN